MGISMGGFFLFSINRFFSLRLKLKDRHLLDDSKSRCQLTSPLQIILHSDLTCLRPGCNTKIRPTCPGLIRSPLTAHAFMSDYFF